MHAFNDAGYHFLAPDDGIYFQGILPSAEKRSWRPISLLLPAVSFFIPNCSFIWTRPPPPRAAKGENERKGVSYFSLLSHFLIVYCRDGIHQIVSRFLERFRYMRPLLFACVFPS
jgi:hypothetical protein